MSDDINWPMDEFVPLLMAYRAAYAVWMGLYPDGQPVDETVPDSDDADTKLDAVLWVAQDKARRELFAWMACHLDDDVDLERVANGG